MPLIIPSCILVAHFLSFSVCMIKNIDWHHLTLYHMTKLWTSPIWKHVQKQNKCNSRNKICSIWDRKHHGKRRKCWLQAFSPFPTMFSEAFYPRDVKIRVVWEGVNPFDWQSLQQKTKWPVKTNLQLTFNHLETRSLLKTLCKKEKVLVTNIFSFLPQCFLSSDKQILVSKSHLFCCLQIWI